LGCHAAFKMPRGYGASLGGVLYDAVRVLGRNGLTCSAALHIAAKAYALGLRPIFGPQFGAGGFGGPFHVGRFHCYLTNRVSDDISARCSRGGQSVRFLDHRQYWSDRDRGWSPPPLNP
jgi:hypothetical protein